MTLALLLSTTLALAPADTVPLYHDLGSHTHRISTAVPLAQKYFDQGLRLVFGFNHGEAIRAFKEAQRRDPTCAMCYWGEAYAWGPHVNAAMDSAGGAAAYQALARAKALAPKATPEERAYIEALATRYAEVPRADRAALDSAYAKAMGDLVRRYPNDLDAGALYAESLMDLRPWNYWQPDGQPYPGTQEIIDQLERVVRANPNHPGACHFYIHAVEAVEPAKAVPCAERLARLMPGAGHMVHMPGHIYIRVGRYDDAIEANEHAVHADETYLREQRPGPGVYALGYYPHNIHFLAFAATMAGKSAQAIEASRTLAAKTPEDVARQVPLAEPGVTYYLLTYVTFGYWDQILAAPRPAADLKFSSGLSHYARGVAFAAKGKGTEAAAALDSLKAIAAQVPEGDARTALDIGAHALAGEIAARSGKRDAAIEHFQAAVALEDKLLYFEPPVWYYPVRQSLGAAFLKAGRAADAERVYREDLKKFPENGWSLLGLAQALRAQDRAKEAEEIEKQFKRAWKHADVPLTASRF